jgi:hypothetical protein
MAPLRHLRIDCCLLSSFFLLRFVLVFLHYKMKGVWHVLSTHSHPELAVRCWIKIGTTIYPYTHTLTWKKYFFTSGEYTIFLDP